MAHKWIVLLVAFEDPEIEPRVLKEKIAAHEDEQLAAFCRGGELITVIEDDNEPLAEAIRRDLEKECLR